MSKFERVPDMNNAKSNPSEIGADVNVGKKPEGELTPEELEKLNETETTQQETISEDTLAQLLESIRIKTELESRVAALKESPEFQEFEKVNLALGEKREKYELRKIVKFRCSK